MVIQSFVSTAENESLLAIANEYRQTGVLQANPSGPGRYRRKIDGTEFATDIVQRIADRITERFDLDAKAIDPYLGWIVSYIEPGAFIKPHIDKQPHYQNSTDKHLRCNVLVQGNDPSARPIVGETVLRVGEQDLWAFFASEYPHGTQPLQSDQPRIVYQFGFTVPEMFVLSKQDDR